MKTRRVHQKALSCTEFCKCQKKASIACAECHKHQKRGAHYKYRCYMAGMWVSREQDACADSVDTIWKSLNSRANCVMR